jgi:hypothetical protein
VKSWSEQTLDGLTTYCFYSGNTLTHAPSGLRQREQVVAGAQDGCMGLVFLKTLAAEFPSSDLLPDDEQGVFRYASQPP